MPVLCQRAGPALPCRSRLSVPVPRGTGTYPVAVEFELFIVAFGEERSVVFEVSGLIVSTVLTLFHFRYRFHKTVSSGKVRAEKNR